MNNFYLPTLTVSSTLVELAGDEAKHMCASRRLGAGDKVTLFNGCGLVADAEIVMLMPKSVTIKINNVVQQPPRPRLILASALPKGSRLNVLLDMATQLGMTDFIPLKYQYSVVTTIDNKVDRYRRVCINSCKQSGRYYVPEIHSPVTPAELIESIDPEQAEIVLAQPSNNTQSIDLNLKLKKIILMVGPEGGFSVQELRLFDQHRINKIRLSDAILRIETACISLLTKMNCRQIN